MLMANTNMLTISIRNANPSRARVVDYIVPIGTLQASVRDTMGYGYNL